MASLSLCGGVVAFGVVIETISSWFLHDDGCYCYSNHVWYPMFRPQMNRKGRLGVAFPLHVEAKVEATLEMQPE